MANVTRGDGDEDTTVATNPQYRRRRPYSSTERMAIVGFLVTNDEYDRVKGNGLWKIMEERKICDSVQ
jgi:hypothetical protein